MKPVSLERLKDRDYAKNASYILRSHFSYGRNLFGDYRGGGSWDRLRTGTHFVPQGWQLVCTPRGDGRGRKCAGQISVEKIDIVYPIAGSGATLEEAFRSLHDRFGLACENEKSTQDDPSHRFPFSRA